MSSLYTYLTAVQLIVQNHKDGSVSDKNYLNFIIVYYAKNLAEMAQISRVYRTEVPVLARVCCNNYNYRRREYSNYYEVLRISPNATQKEIRDAYIKLSKEMHPDRMGQGNHIEFVKLNEAYSILSNKRKCKQHFDMDVTDYTVVHPDGSFHHYGNSSTSRQWKDFSAQYSKNSKKYNTENRRKAFGYCVLFIIIGSFIQILHLKKLIEINKRAMSEKTKKLQLECQRLMMENENKTLEEKFVRLRELSKKHGIHTTDK